MRREADHESAILCHQLSMRSPGTKGEFSRGLRKIQLSANRRGREAIDENAQENLVIHCTKTAILESNRTSYNIPNNKFVFCSFDFGIMTLVESTARTPVGGCPMLLHEHTFNA